MHEKLSWKPHIANVTSKASQSLGFIRRNLAQCSTATKQLAYTTLVRSQLEYAGAILDPYRQNQVDQLERVQRRVVRFISGNYNREDSVTAMREELGLPPLQKRRQHSRWVMMHKIIHGHVAIPRPDYIQPRARTTRSQQQHRFTRLSTSSDSYKHSFFPRTLKEWDGLPQNIIELPSVEQFKEAIATL
ncbi:uncharacterized protein [Amphiura filiformis]|uniref:uncharacterized protein n=1 Tax=Amphiura filiformis TaxID=82378 RepID=UPI003B21882D